MTVSVAHRARETTATTGTGTYTLDGPVAGFQTLVSAAIDIEGGAGPWLVHGVVTDGTDWEVGVYTLTDASPDTLARTNIIASSNGGAAVNWGAAAKSVFIWPLAPHVSNLLDDQAGDGFLVRIASGVYGAVPLTGSGGIAVANASGHNASGTSAASPIISLDIGNMSTIAAMVAGDVFAVLDQSSSANRGVPLSGITKASGGIIARGSAGLAFESSALGGSTGAVATSDLVVIQTPGGVPRVERADALPVGPTLGTEDTTTGGTSIDFTGLPSGIKRITVMGASMSTTGSSPLQIQLGDSGGIETTGYVGSVADDAGTLRTNFSSGLLVSPTIGSGTSANFTAILTVLDGNTWSFSCEMGRDDAARMYHSAGNKALSAELDRIRFTTTGGTNTFDANGGINIMYEV